MTVSDGMLLVHLKYLANYFQNVERVPNSQIAEEIFGVQVVKLMCKMRGPLLREPCENGVKACSKEFIHKIRIKNEVFDGKVCVYKETDQKSIELQNENENEAIDSKVCNETDQQSIELQNEIVK